MTETVVVDGYADLVQDPTLSGRDQDIVARELEVRDPEDGFVAWAPAWLLEEADVAAAKPSRNIVGGTVEATSQKAWLILQGSDQDWLPFSQCTRYRARAGVEFEVPQSGLDDWGPATGPGGGRA